MSCASRTCCAPLCEVARTALSILFCPVRRLQGLAFGGRFGISGFDPDVPDKRRASVGLDRDFRSGPKLVEGVRREEGGLFDGSEWWALERDDRRWNHRRSESREKTNG
jgi:hypothetical protein